MVRRCRALFLPLLTAGCLASLAGCGAGNLLGQGSHPPDVSVSIAPSVVSLSIGATQPFTASVTGSDNTAVNWSVQEGAAGGSITEQGLYTAPGAPGTYHILASYSLQPDIQAIATVTVQAADLPVVVD